MRRTAVAVAVGAVVLTGLVTARPAAASEYAGIDWEFGPAPTTAAGPWQIAVDPQDRTLLLSQGRLERFGADGTPDAAFGEVEIGFAVSSYSLDLLDGGITSVVRQQYSSASIVRVDATGDRLASFGEDGELALPGTTNGHPIAQAADGTFFVVQPIAASDISIAKYDATGEIDTSYGSGGIATVACCGTPGTQPSPKEVVVNDDGTLDLVVFTNNGGAAVRLDASGDLLGTLALTAGTNEHPERLVPMADGSKLLVGRDNSLPFQTSGTIRRITPAWAIDPAFGGSGVVSYAPVGWSDPILQPERAVFVLGGGASIELLGLDADGIDTSFGTAGRVSMQSPTSPYAVSYSTQDIRTIGLSGGQILTIGSASWSSVNQFESTQRTVTIERTVDGALVSTSTSGEAWIGPMAARHDGSASVMFSASRTGLGTVPVSAYITRWVRSDASAPLGPVRSLGAEVGGEVVGLSWQRPAEVSGLRVFGYKGRVVRPKTGAEVTSWTSEQTSKEVILPTGEAYRVEVRPVGFQGEGPLPTTPLIVIPHFASVGAFSRQMAEDFGLPAPTAKDVADLTTALEFGSVELEFAVRAAADGATWAKRLDPVVRLYAAYFGRPPDPSGLTYWMGRRASGTSVAKISSTFAGSSEFKRKYGSLGNQAFVALVYRNVLDREADSGGLTYWTNRLNRGTTSRGQLMASFSESGEHVRRRDPLVRTVGAYWAMLRRLPTTTELQTWTGPSPAGDEAALVRALLAHPEYLARLD